MDPMTMPAMAPPLSVADDDCSAKTVTVACRAARIGVGGEGMLAVGSAGILGGFEWGFPSFRTASRDMGGRW